MPPFNILLFFLLLAGCWTVLEGWSRGKTGSMNAMIDLEDRIYLLNMEMENLALNISSYRQTEQELAAVMNNFYSRMDKAAASAFFISNVDKRRKYYAKKHQHLFHYETAQSVCALFDGYLAEINDAAELRFIINFLVASQVPDDKAVYVGAKLVETKWQYGRSGSPIGAFPWASGFPRSEKDMNCACVVNRQLKQCICPEHIDNAKANLGGRSYLCEVQTE